MFKSFKQSFIAPILLALVLSGIAHSADAAVYAGSWDPAYGAPFTGLGWAGTVQFEVPLSPPCSTSGTACLGSGATAAYLQSAEVLFYDLADPTRTTIASIDWSQSQLSGVNINRLLFAGSALTELATDLFPALRPTLTVDYPTAKDFGHFADDLFSLQFVINQRVSVNPVVDFSGPRLYWTANCTRSDDRRTSTHDNDNDECPGGANDVLQSPPQNFVIAQVRAVPEPTTAALASIALLAAAGVAARRRRV